MLKLNENKVYYTYIFLTVLKLHILYKYRDLSIFCIRETHTFLKHDNINFRKKNKNKAT